MLLFKRYLYAYFLLLLFALMGCDEQYLSPYAGNFDYYSTLKPHCDYRLVRGILADWENSIPGYTSVFDRHEMGPTCFNALEDLLKSKFTSSWLQAPTGAKERVYEALQILLAYPLKFPETGTIFQQFPIDEPAIQFFTTEGEESLNQKILNYILNRIDYISYESTQKRKELSLLASYVHSEKRLTLTDSFLGDAPLGRINTLFHEARHYDKDHISCRKNRFQILNKDLRRSKQCDDELDDAFGFGLLLFLSFLHANFDSENPTTYFSGNALDLEARIQCRDLHNFFREKSFPDLIRFIDHSLGSADCTGMNIQHLLQWEGLALPKTIAADLQNQPLSESSQEDLIFRCGYGSNEEESRGD